MKLATFSFDDGGPGDFTVLDLFESRNLVPTFYIASALLNMDEMIYGMASPAIKERYVGAEIGSHAVSHPHLSLQNAESTRFELEVSRQVIREKLSVDTELFAHPYGSTGPHTDAQLQASGYRWARRIWRPWNMEKRCRFGMPISAMFTNPEEVAAFRDLCASGEDIHILCHSWMIVKRDQMEELDQWIALLLANGYTILPNSAYFEATFRP